MRRRAPCARRVLLERSAFRLAAGRRPVLDVAVEAVWLARGVHAGVSVARTARRRPRGATVRARSASRRPTTSTSTHRRHPPAGPAKGHRHGSRSEDGRAPHLAHRSLIDCATQLTDEQLDETHRPQRRRRPPTRRRCAHHQPSRRPEWPCGTPRWRAASTTSRSRSTSRSRRRDAGSPWPHRSSSGTCVTPSTRAVSTTCSSTRQRPALRVLLRDDRPRADVRRAPAHAGGPGARQARRRQARVGRPHRVARHGATAPDGIRPRHPECFGPATCHPNGCRIAGRKRCHGTQGPAGHSTVVVTGSPSRPCGITVHHSSCERLTSLGSISRAASPPSPLGEPDAEAHLDVLQVVAVLVLDLVGPPRSRLLGSARRVVTVVDVDGGAAGDAGEEQLDRRELVGARAERDRAAAVVARGVAADAVAGQRDAAQVLRVSLGRARVVLRSWDAASQRSGSGAAPGPWLSSTRRRGARRSAAGPRGRGATGDDDLVDAGRLDEAGESVAHTRRACPTSETRSSR